ncbi:DUF1127 domain-containing protein [Paenirhodobacter sp.]|uniref:DUF1127 domain-containing protein n=1 Tax=Paenirhodobacter sp. TaxID=1965326 RepID=UPI003B3E28AF
MAIASDIHEHHFGLAHLFAGFREALARRRVFRETVRELRGLTGRELADLGLNRSMIKSVAFEAAYGK